MLAVSNTSPLSNLAWIGRLDLLWHQLPDLRIPTAVAREIEDHPDASAREMIQSAILESRIVVCEPHDTRLRGILRQQLHGGEADAIALAADLKADLILIDELEGRTVAGQAGLAVSGTLGILLRAKRTGELTSIAPEIAALRQRARFFLSPALEKQVLIAAGEER